MMRSGAPVMSSYTPAYTTPQTIGGVGAGRVVGAPTVISGTQSFGTSYSARPTTLGTAAPVSYTTVPSQQAQYLSSAATATSFTAGTPVISSSARVVQQPQAYVSQLQGQYVGSAMTIPTVTAAPVTYVSEAMAAPIAYEMIAPGIVEVAAPGVVETIVQGGIVETVSAGAAEPLPEGPLVLTYWPLFGKGAAAVVALQVGGFNWQLGAAPGSKGTGDLWGEWLEMKPYTPWGFLPNLDVGGEQIGSELAILQFLARKAGAPLEGGNDFEYRISQELLHQSEELYQKLAKQCPTIMAPDKSPADFEQLWTNGDRTTHSSQQGIPVYLTQFEEYYAKVGGRDGLFTSSGVTIGEVKLYATLALLLLIDNGILSNYPGLLEFYMRWENDPRIRVALENGDATTILDVALQEWGWQQYFIAPPPPAEQEQAAQA